MPQQIRCFDESICQEFQTAMRVCFDNNLISQMRHKKFIRYHFSTIQKIRATQYFRDKIKDIIEQSTSIGRDELFKVNLYFDGYLYNFQSVMDMLGQEINVLYMLNFPEKKVDLYTILQKLNSAHTSLDITRCLNSHISTSPKSWWNIVRNFRNAISHRQVIGEKLVETLIWDEHQAPHIEPHIPLLSDFNKASKTKLIDFCNLNFKRMCNCIEDVYKINTRRLNNNERIPFK